MLTSPTHCSKFVPTSGFDTMHCAHCQTDNSSSARFCRNCGQPLSAPPAEPGCPHCQRPIIGSAKFCRHCGQPVAERSISAASPLETPPPSPAVQPAAVPAAAPEAEVAAAPPIHAKLVCTTGVLQGMSFRVGSGVVLGRAPDVDIVIDDAQISKRHAWVGAVGHQLQVRDLKSTNGTFLNDKLDLPVNECELKEGDLLVLGKHGQVKFRVTMQ